MGDASADTDYVRRTGICGDVRDSAFSCHDRSPDGYILDTLYPGGGGNSYSDFLYNERAAYIYAVGRRQISSADQAAAS